MSAVTFLDKRHKFNTLSGVNLAPFIGVAVTVAIFAFFNAQLIAAYVVMWTQPPATDYAIAASVSESDKKAPDETVSEDPLLIVPGAGIRAPVVYGVTSTAEADVQRGLEKGVLHFGNSALPGEIGNAIFAGHSSGQPWAPGDYKFVFTQLNRLEPGARVQLAHNGTAYTYAVTVKTIVAPDDVSVLKQTEAATATFITCWPLGVNAKRLIVKAKLVSHEPRQRASAAPLTSEPELPGNPYSATQSLQQRLR